MKVYASDIETKGGYEDVNSKEDIHCLCSIDIDSGDVYLYHDYPEFDGATVVDPYDGVSYVLPKRNGNISDGVRFWEQVSAKGDKLSIHNCHTYDRVILNKIFPNNSISFKSYHDTFNQSKLQWYERPIPKGAKSAHGLKAYGIKFGINKPEITEWVTFDAFKLHRCIEDCKIQAETHKFLEKERLYLYNEFGIDFTMALKIEDLYASECALQEINGILIDKEHVKSCIKDLDEKVEVLKQKITPHLPPTLKGVGTKISRKEMAELFGFDSSKIKETSLEKKKNGEIETVVEKPYFKPVTKYTRVETVLRYVVFSVSGGILASFDKKAEARKWVNDNADMLKSNDLYADFEIVKDELKTTQLKPEVAKWFGIEVTNLDLIGGAFTKVEIEKSTLEQSDIVKEYLIRLGWKDAVEWNLKTDVHGNYIKTDYPLEIRWPPKASPENQMVKKIDKGGYLVSSPKLSEEDYGYLPEGVGKQIAEYNTYQHRRRFLENKDDPENKGLLSYIRKDGRVGAGVNNFATRSGRG